MIEPNSVVLQFVSTSNHNSPRSHKVLYKLYFNSFLHQTTTSCLCMIPETWLYFNSFLHQTTTLFSISKFLMGCTSIRFYIKPQLGAVFKALRGVVLQFVSTSNHNYVKSNDGHDVLYFNSFLHQTTTRALVTNYAIRCTSIRFYIKPQLPLML